MAKPNGTLDGVIQPEPTKVEATEGEDDDEDDPQWGTWEQLLLACAVNRYGTNSWDPVAVEIQKRSSAASLLLTPSNCRKKYQHLTRRFFTRKDQRDASNGGPEVASGDGAGSIITTDESVPLLEELRKLRVAELRLELERYDLSIVSLQSKVNKMKEERERSSSENGERNSSDLCRKSEKEAKRDDNEPELKREVKDEPDKSPLSVAGGPISDKDELSVNESISTDQRSSHEDTGTRGNTGEEPKEPGRTGGEVEEPDRAGEEKPVREEDSCYGSSDSVEKEEAEPVVQNEVKVEPGSVSGSPGSVESVAESEEEGGVGQEEATTKEECSDVQSSATKSRRAGDNVPDHNHVVRGSSDHGDLEKTSKSATVKIECSVESQPLMDFLEDVKRHKLGSVFLRRLDSQETQNYKNLIRQHVDLETVQARVKEGAYLDGHLKFFRDLLLLVSNATVFFSKNTPEFIAASELRNLISNKMSQKNAKSDSSSDKQPSIQKEVSLPKKENSEPSESLLLKPKLGGPLIFCRKRSSIAAKATAAATSTATATATSSGSDKKKEQTTKLSEEKGGPESKQPPNQPPTKAEELRITKKRSRDRFVPVPANMKKNGKNGANTNSKQTSEKSLGKGGSSSQQQEPRSESKSKNSNVDLKKRSAANFLNRMKQGSSSNNGPLLDALKSAPLTTGNSSRGGFDQKKNENGKGSGKKERVSARVSDVKQPKEKGSPAKKSLGRPPKKGAAPPPPPPSGKRSRDGRESESVASNHKRKRSRK